MGFKKAKELGQQDGAHAHGQHKTMTFIDLYTLSIGRTYKILLTVLSWVVIPDGYSAPAKILLQSMLYCLG